MKIDFFANRINAALWQYTFTQMYSEQDILFHINSALIDLYTYQDWEFAVKVYTSLSEWTSFTLDSDKKILKVMWVEKVDWVNRRMCEYAKYGDFYNTKYNTTWVYEYDYDWSVITVSESMNIEVKYLEWPQWYDNISNTELDVPDLFNWALYNMVMASMLPLYLSDGIAVWQNYFQKAEVQLQRLSSTIWHKYWNKWIWVKWSERWKKTASTIYTR